MLLCTGRNRVLPVGQCNLFECDKTFIGARQIGKETGHIQAFKSKHDVDQHLAHAVHFIEQGRDDQYPAR